MDTYFEGNFNDPTRSTVNADQNLSVMKSRDLTSEGRVVDVHDRSFNLSLGEVACETVPDVLITITAPPSRERLPLSEQRHWHRTQASQRAAILQAALTGGTTDAVPAELLQRYASLWRRRLPCVNHAPCRGPDRHLNARARRRPYATTSPA